MKRLSFINIKNATNKLYGDLCVNEIMQAEMISSPIYL